VLGTRVKKKNEIIPLSLNNFQLRKECKLIGIEEKWKDRERKLKESYGGTEQEKDRGRDLDGDDRDDRAKPEPRRQW
jgi:hypothetical protein